MGDETALGPEVVVTLPVWAGFSSGPPGRASKGAVTVDVGGDAMIEENDEITPEHTAAYRFSLEHAGEMQPIVLDAIAGWFATIRERYAKAGIAMPASVDRTSLRSLVSLNALSIHHAHARGLAYVGYSFSCAWDREHGLGVMTHERRVVRVGGADTAILGWIARQDVEGTAKVARPSAATKAAPKKPPVADPRTLRRGGSHMKDRKLVLAGGGITIAGMVVGASLFGVEHAAARTAYTTRVFAREPTVDVDDDGVVGRRDAPHSIDIPSGWTLIGGGAGLGTDGVLVLCR
jgi:hypothetical protein